MMAADVWKEYESNEISHSVAHHLVAIHELMGDLGYARVSDVARTLEITRGSASLTLKALKGRGLVLEDRNKFLKLSEDGRNIVDSVLAKRTIVHKFLNEVLKLDAHQAEVDACKVEHLLSAKTGEQLLHFVRFLLSDDPTARQFLAEFWRKLARTADGQWPVQDVDQLFELECR